MSENPLLERAKRFVSALRHCQVLGITAHQASEEGITLIMPYAPHLVGDPQSGVIHGGALTSLLGTAALSSEQWLLGALPAVVLLIVWEIGKAIARRFHKQRPRGGARSDQQPQLTTSS